MISKKGINSTQSRAMKTRIMTTENEIVPEHMAPWIRMERLYEFLKNMGLFVIPMPYDDDRTKISWLPVSVVLPVRTLEEQIDRLVPSSGGSVPVSIHSPLKGSQVREVVTPSVPDGDNMVDFPPVD